MALDPNADFTEAADLNPLRSNARAPGQLGTASTEDIIAKAARLNLRDVVTEENRKETFERTGEVDTRPIYTEEMREKTIENKEDLFEDIVKNTAFGDKWRAFLKGQKEGVWDAEALVLLDGSLLNPMNSLGNTANIFMLMISGFIAGNPELSERAAILSGWNDDEVQPGDRITTYADMADAAASFTGRPREDFVTAPTALDDASERIRGDFPTSAAEPIQIGEAAPALDPSLDIVKPV